uniref:Uncharacterized protein n=1 Tax=Anguilla anguilla TaxID=7936 RepID=A0A0E9RW59_ANGAN
MGPVVTQCFCPHQKQHAVSHIAHPRVRTFFHFVFQLTRPHLMNELLHDMCSN